jgi:hypothetical protein
MFTQSNANANYFTTCPQTTLVFESSELIPASATAFAVASTVSITQGSSTTLSIGNGASAAAPQYVRFGSRSRAITSAVTLTLASGSATGTVYVYAYLNASNALKFFITDTSGNTFTAGTNQTVASATGANIPQGSILLYTWPVTAGAFAASGTSNQASTDAWVDAIEVANETGSAATITVTDGQGTVINLFDTTSVGANATLTYYHPGGRFFDGGVFLTAGTASALQVNIRMARLRQSPASSGLNP